MQESWASRGRHKHKARKARGLLAMVRDMLVPRCWRRICLGTYLKYPVFKMKETRYFPTGSGELRQLDWKVRNN